MSNPPDVGVDVGQARSFLARHLSREPSELALIGEGAWSRSFGFRLDEEALVIRFGKHVEDFQKDQLAYAFAAPALPIPRVLEEYRRLAPDLNVLAFVTAILPAAMVDHPPRRSLCFHPSLLPRFRGGNALAWQIMLGERESGVSVFRPDAGVDTGPLVVQKGGVAIEDMGSVR